MPKGYADIPKGQVSYRTKGSEESLLLVQRMRVASEYSEMIPARNYRVVAKETLGYGNSENLP